ncbi:hypothetical protein GCM10027275_20930 [Rhabdobacter roseus]|uniref:ZU5 domain-containing protein n=1 Tax=Rhabdobacter roseus TaxID=1655419 RepID=A0A840TIM5_9BACT|nr:hypothetical protein [Rhabdobacter roseus]MBB5284026.1 hypothetical protein [Rhabdobacter roseus]
MKTIFRLLPLLFLGLLACHQPGPNVEPSPGTGGGTPTEVGKPIGAVTTKIIGAAGGYLSTPDGKLTLTFPAGALTTDTPVTIQPVENKAINGLGIGYEFGPDGTKFAKPVTFTYHYEANELLGTTPQAMALASQNAQGIWVMERFVKVDPATRTITGKLDHFSWWSIITLFHMTPEAGVVGPGQSLKLRVTQAAELPDMLTSTNVDDLPLLAELSVKATKNALIKEISLNGNSKWSDLLNPANPNGYLGYDASGKEAVIEYFAPARIPEQNPVAVSVTLALPSKAQFMLVSNISVMRENSFTVKGTTFDDV